MDSTTPVCSPPPPQQQQQLLVAGSLLLPGGSQYMARSDATTNKRSDREHLLELEHKLLEARQRLQDLKDDTTGGNVCWPKVSSGCKCYPPSRSLRDSQKLNMSTTSGLSLRSNAESSRRSRTSHHRQRQPVTRSLGSVAVEQAPTNAEGLLLAVDKFLSAVESPHSKATISRSSGSLKE
ncbi:unnamed protein product [Sphagnum balticum]